MADDLPIGWEFVTFPEVVFFQEGPGLRKYQYRESGIPFLNIRTFVDEKIDKKLCNYLDPEEVEQKYKHFLIDANDILVATSGSIGKIAIASSKDLPLMLNTSIMRFRPIDEQVLERRFLYFFLKSNHFFTQAKSAWTGTAQKNMGPSHVKTFTILLPPLNEQRRIVEKLDRIFDRLRKVRDELSHIKKLIDRYRQAVLTAACSSENYENGEIVDIQSVAHVGTGSTPLKSNSSYYADIGIPWIISAATNQPFVTEASEFVTEYAISECRLKKYPIGTLLVAMYGEGKTRGQVTELAIEATINQACAAIIVNESLACKEYVKLALQANYFEMRQLAEGGNQPNLNLSKIRNFLIFLPPLEEQKEIVRRVEERFARIDKLEQEYQKAVKLCDRLEQATLAKAFRGELVSQDPNDEPASVLLERIRAEQQSKTQAKTAKSKKRSGKK
jgi:type I restriction enzyme S subunit